MTTLSTNELHEVAIDAADRVSKHGDAMEGMMVELAKLPNSVDRLALLAALTHFTLSLENESVEMFDNMLKGLLLLCKPDNATRVMMNAHHFKA